MNKQGRIRELRERETRLREIAKRWAEKAARFDDEGDRSAAADARLAAAMHEQSANDAKAERRRLERG